MEGNLIKKYVNTITFWERYNQKARRTSLENTQTTELPPCCLPRISAPSITSSTPPAEAIDKEAILKVCNVNRDKRACLNLGAVTYSRFLAKAEPFLGVRVHEVVLEENGLIVNDNNFTSVHKEPLMLLQTGEKWFNSDTSGILDYVRKGVGNKLVAVCNHTRERKTVLKIPSESDFFSFLMTASKYLNINGKMVACEDTGMIVNDLDILNAKEKVLMILGHNEQWHPR